MMFGTETHRPRPKRKTSLDPHASSTTQPTNTNTNNKSRGEPEGSNSENRSRLNVDTRTQIPAFKRVKLASTHFRAQRFCALFLQVALARTCLSILSFNLFDLGRFWEFLADLGIVSLSVDKINVVCNWLCYSIANYKTSTNNLSRSTPNISEVQNPSKSQSESIREKRRFQDPQQ